MEVPSKIPHKEYINIVQCTSLIACDLLLKRGDTILMGVRKNEPAKGYLFNPGGRMYKKEGLIECILRILQTEVQFVPKKQFRCHYIGSYCHSYDTNFAKIDNIGTEYYTFAYSINAEHWDIVMENSDEQHEQFMWVPIQSILEGHYQQWKIHPNVTQFFKVFPNNKIGSITITP